MDLEQAIAFLMGQDRSAVLTALQNKAQPLYQAVFDKGHGEATTRAKARIEEIDAKLNKATDDLTKAQAQLESLGKDKPDTQKYLDRIATLEKEVADVKASADKTVNSVRLEKGYSDLGVALTGLKVDPEYVTEVLLKRDDIRSRIKASGDKLEVLSQNGIPFTPVEGKTPFQLLAEELATKVPPKWVGSGVEPGSGIKEGGAGGTPATVFDQIRADIEKRKPDGPVGIAALETRLGLTSTTK